MRVVIADDDKQIVEVLAAFVSACGHEVVDTVTAGGLAVIQSCARHRPDIVLLDIIMPKFNGFTVCQQLVSRNPKVKVLLISGLVDCEYPSVSNCGAVGYLQKPMRFEQIQEALIKMSSPSAERARPTALATENPVRLKAPAPAPAPATQEEPAPSSPCEESSSIELIHSNPIGLLGAPATA
jgi:YesN/AraC family two-component response regulator